MTPKSVAPPAKRCNTPGARPSGRGTIPTPHRTIPPAHPLAPRPGELRRAYLSTPKDQFTDPRYPEVVRAIQARFSPDRWLLIQPAVEGWSNSDWREFWPGLCKELSLLLVWPRPDLSIGKGSLTELRDALARGASILAVNDRLKLCPIERLESLENFVPDRLPPYWADLSDWRRIALVHPGEELR